MRRARVALLLAFALVAIGSLLFACQQNPVTVPIRTFERAQKVDVLCLRLAGPDAPEPLPQEECAPVPPDVNGENLANQLFALVTQTSRGEVAVVNLSSGAIVDERHAIPGLNFLPVGANPTDVATTPDGRMAFVTSAEPNKFAIYGIPGYRILGDRAPEGLERRSTTITSWPVCALPQRPGALSVVPRRPPVGAPPPTAADPAYELVAVLPGDRIHPAKVVTIDPRPFLRASPRKALDGRVLDDFGAGPALTPGQLEPCPITSAIELAGEAAVPETFRPGARWADGVAWVDGGADIACELPAQPASCGLPSCRCADPTTGKPLGTSAEGPDAATADGGDDVGAADAGAAPACDPDGGRHGADAERALDLGPLDAPQPVAIARVDQTLYVADDAIPLIHVIDLSVAGAPRELPPLVASSMVDPSRVVSIRDLAVSPPTRDYKRYLYAVDRKEGSIAVFDVTDPQAASRSPLRRPHPELNPFQPPDRISFIAPVVSVAFARHDFPLTRIDGIPQPNAQTGVVCNPNPNAGPAGGGLARDFGFYYRQGSRDLDVGLGPGRLRGVFAFATLSNGDVVTIDVDDWDAPCRRPATLDGVGPNTPVLASVPQPVPGADDLDPYHAPTAPPGSVSEELFYPISSPHRPRSQFLLRDDPSSGKHVPFLQSAPTLSSTKDVTPPLVGPGSEVSPKLRPTAARPGADTTGTEEIGVRFSFDDPNVHFDQDWTVTYEGKLPGFDGLPATISTTDGYSSVVLSQPQGRFCSKGVEDWTAGGERANAVVSALASAGRPAYSERLERRMVDYVQIVDDLLPASDPFWRQADLPEPDSCWDPRLVPANPGDPRQVEAAASRRFDLCSSFFGSAVEQNENRDFPILEAYDDRLVLGRFVNFTQPGQSPPLTREVVYVDPSNAAQLKLMRCCFHHQVNFSVRAGAQWLTSGTRVGVLNHVVRGAGDRCVQSCDARQSLLNARAPSLPSAAAGSDFAPFRDSPLAVRNPALSFFVQNGRDPETGRDRLPTRDMAFQFQTRGEFSPLTIDLAASTSSVSPQSMRFIESLGQLAVVDAATQGLVLIDLSKVAIARAPYF